MMGKGERRSAGLRHTHAHDSRAHDSHAERLAGSNVHNGGRAPDAVDPVWHLALHARGGETAIHARDLENDS